MSPTLRQKLDDIAAPSQSFDPNHRSKVAALKEGFHHSIRFVANGENGQDCAGYAVEIDLELIRDALPAVRPREFFEWYYRNELEEDSKGELVVYFMKDKPEHVGVGQGQRIKSKWGLNPIYEHEEWEVPASYGEKIVRYRKPSKREAMQTFIKFVKQHIRYKMGDVNAENFEERVRKLDL